MGRVNRRISVFIACLVVGSMVGGMALEAFAHDRTFNRRITIRYASRSDQFKGRIRSRHPECRANQSVTLYENGTAVGTTTTDSSGVYSFSRTATAGATYYVRVEETLVEGGYGHTHRCKAAQSSTIQPVSSSSTTTAARSSSSQPADEGFLGGMLAVLGNLLSSIF